MIALCGEKHRRIQQPYGFKAMNVELSKKLAFVFIYEHEKVMFLFLLRIITMMHNFRMWKKTSRDSTTVWFQGYECWIV